LERNNDEPMRKGKISSIRWRSNKRSWDKKGRVREQSFNHIPQHLQQLEEQNRSPRVRRKLGDDWIEL
jgi:hypothetical protein